MSGVAGPGGGAGYDPPGNGGCRTAAAVLLGIFLSVPLSVFAFSLTSGASGVGGIALYTLAALGGGLALAVRRTGTWRGIGIGLMIGWALFAILAALCLSTLSE